MDTNSQSPLDMIHMDLCGPTRVKSLARKKYMLVLVDEFSRFTCFEFLRAKSDAADRIITFIKRIQVLLGRKVKKLDIDNETEFQNAKLQSFLEDVGISHNFSAVRTPQQNGVVERKNRMLVEAARSMMAHLGVPQAFWAEAVSTACYMQNRTLIVKRTGKTAYEIVEQRKPNIDYFKVFGCKFYVLNDPDNLGKFDPMSNESIFIGYSHNSKTYRVFNKRTRTILESSNVDLSETETYSDASPSNLNALLPELYTAPPSTDSASNTFASDFIDLADYDLPTLTRPIVVPAQAGSTTTSVSSNTFVTDPSSSTSTNSMTPESVVSPPETSSAASPEPVREQTTHPVLAPIPEEAPLPSPSSAQRTYAQDQDQETNEPVLQSTDPDHRSEYLLKTLKIAQPWEISSFSLVNRRIVVNFGQRLHDSLFFDLTGGIEHRRLQEPHALDELWGPTRVQTDARKGIHMPLDLALFDTGSAGKPPRFNKDNFSLWKTRMELFLSGSDPQIPYFLENGPHVPTQPVHVVPPAGDQPAIPARELVKPVTDWNDEDRRLVNIDTKARSLIAMSLPDDVFHSVCHLRSAKEIWDTLCVQYEGTAVLMESRKIFLVRQYESFIHQKDETLSQLHQRYNCLLNDLKTIGTIYPNSEVVTKFMEAFPEHWEMYTSCLTMSKDIKTLTLSELYGILLNREQQKKLKKNLIRDTKDSKSTSVALVSDSVPPIATPSSVTITELESSDSDMSEDPEFNESLALLTRSFRKFAKKGNFHKKKPLTLTDKPKTEPVDKATAICYNCQGKGHFADDCRYRKSQFAPSSAKSSSKNPKYQRLKEKYKKMNFQRKGKGLIAEDCDWDDVSSDDSYDEEDIQVALMAIIEEPTLALMNKIEEVPEEVPTQAPEASTSATESASQVPTPVVPLESFTQLDLVTLDLYKAMNGKTSAEKMNIDLRDQLRECQEKIKQLTILEESYKDQVTVNQILCIEREKALAAKERALAELNAEKVTIKGWSDASEKVDEILASGRNVKNKKGLGFTSGCTRPDCSMPKFGMFVSSIPDPNAPENIPSSSNKHTEGAPKSKKKTAKEKSKTVRPSKTKNPKPKNKVLGGGPSVSGTKSFSQNPAPRLKIDLKQKIKEKKPIPPLSNAKGILGTGPAHLKFKDFLDPTKRFQYRKCYHCGFNDHIASKCPDATKTEKSAKDKGIWYLDNGCSRHMTGSKSVLSNYREERGPAVTFGGNGKGQTRGYGTLTNRVTTFKRVAYVEGRMHNLLSISQLCDKNHKVSFSKKKCKVKNRRKEVILTGVRQADIYIINMNTSTDNLCFVSRASTDTNWLWHKRLSHLNFKTLNQLCINNLVVGLPDFRYTKVSLCSACEKGK
ncbi:hypothetical protein OSB04_024349 [Centaurea solstitialis]|uniref:Retrovirus-related Pol polyprotein from transposon TNT 1-94 n=1 Tax=Centaurea solstitialis TaxID=347529 RepID=A0AA38W0J3_9ASTR|nr:hypothetical protein OSB04_024349 [Centaurea solstitialis]